LSGLSPSGKAEAKQVEVSCFFFSKKKALPELASLHPIALHGAATPLGTKFVPE
jgi:hypothetical protein